MITHFLGFDKSKLYSFYANAFTLSKLNGFIPTSFAVIMLISFKQLLKGFGFSSEAFVKINILSFPNIYIHFSKAFSIFLDRNSLSSYSVNVFPLSNIILYIPNYLIFQKFKDEISLHLTCGRIKSGSLIRDLIILVK